MAINYSDLFPTLIVGYSKERGCACPRNLGKAAITLLQDDLRSTYHQARQDHIRKWRLIRMTYSDRISLCLDTLTICRSNNCRRTLLAASRLAARCMYVVGIEATLQRNHEIIHVSSSLSHRPFRILARASLAQLCSARNSA